jgi:hypothetical protein
MVKLKIQDRVGIPPDQMFILFEGRKMEEEELWLSDLGIHAGSLLHVVVHQE